jgi:hypothetical protein
MYQFSRAMFRDIAPHIADGAPRADVLRACEAAVERIALDPGFKRPARSLFAEIRGYFPLPGQQTVWAVVQREVGAALECLAENPHERYAVTGAPESCGATNRRGGPCSRAPVAGTGYCPSHQHVAGNGGDDALAA